MLQLELVSKQFSCLSSSRASNLHGASSHAQTKVRYAGEYFRAPTQKQKGQIWLQRPRSTKSTNNQSSSPDSSLQMLFLFSFPLWIAL